MIITIFHLPSTNSTADLIYPLCRQNFGQSMAGQDQHILPTTTVSNLSSNIWAYISGNGTFIDYFIDIREILTFSKKKVFLIFRKTETPKKFLIFQETELSYISGNRNFKKLLKFQEATFWTRKVK